MLTINPDAPLTPPQVAALKGAAGTSIMLGSTKVKVLRTSVRMFAGEPLDVLVLFEKAKPGLGQRPAKGACACCGKRTLGYATSRGSLKGGVVPQGEWLCKDCHATPADEDWRTITIGAAFDDADPTKR